MDTKVQKKVFYNKFSPSSVSYSTYKLTCIVKSAIFRDIPPCNPLSSAHQNFLVIMETERNAHHAFLDTDGYRKPDRSLGHTVNRYRTHTNVCLNSGSYHRLSNKQAVIFTLLQTATTLCDQDSLRDKLVFLWDFHKQNCCTDRIIFSEPSALSGRLTSPKECQIQSLRDIWGWIFNHNSRVLCWHSVMTVGVLPKKMYAFLHLVKDEVGLKVREVYNIRWVRSGLHKVDRLAPDWSSANDIAV
jgi:hypothetical protein